MTTNDLLSAIVSVHQDLNSEPPRATSRGIAIAASVYDRIQSVGASPSVWHDCRCVIDPAFDDSACIVHKGQGNPNILRKEQA